MDAKIIRFLKASESSRGPRLKFAMGMIRITGSYWRTNGIVYVILYGPGPANRYN
jgi:hypothetical protein